MIKYKPIVSSYENSWLLKILGKNPERKKFVMLGTINWMRALAILIEEEKQNLELFYKNVQLKPNFSNKIIEGVFSRLAMSLDFLNTLSLLNTSDGKTSLIRIAIISWYYGVYNAAQAMIMACDSSQPTNHTQTANEWYIKFASKKLVPAPFHYALSSLVEKEYTEEIKQYPGYELYDNSRPRDKCSAIGMYLANLKNTANWYVNNKHKSEIKRDRAFRELGVENFRTKEAQKICDEFLRAKPLSFLHQANRYRGKSNYRDVSYIIYSKELTGMIEGLVMDLKVVLQAFINMAIYYCKKRFPQDRFKNFSEDLRLNSNFLPEIIDFLK